VSEDGMLNVGGDPRTYMQYSTVRQRLVLVVVPFARVGPDRCEHPSALPP
jgi:hypothetical protein